MSAQAKSIRPLVVIAALAGSLIVGLEVVLFLLQIVTPEIGILAWEL